MKNPDRNTVSKLDALPNIGKTISKDLELIGIDHPKKLVGKSADAVDVHAPRPDCI
jgi:hypothetical protein